MHQATERLLHEVRACTLCRAQLPLGPKPVFQFHPRAQILIAGANAFQIRGTLLNWNLKGLSEND